MRKLSIILSLFLLALTLTACTEQSVEFEISFNSNGGTEVGSVIIKDNTITLPDEPTKEGFIFNGWYLDNESFENSLTSNSVLDQNLFSDIIVYANWIEIKSDSLNNLEECISNLCNDTDVEDLLGLYINEYIDNEFTHNPFIDSEQRPNFYGQTEYPIIGFGYLDYTGSYPDVMMKLYSLQMIYNAVRKVDVSIATIVNYSTTYSVREDNNSYTLSYSYDAYGEYDILVLSYFFKDEYNVETVEIILSYLEELEKQFEDLGEVHLRINTTDEDLKIIYLSETREVSIELENLIDTLNPETRLSELKEIIESILDGEYSIKTNFLS